MMTIHHRSIWLDLQRPRLSGLEGVDECCGRQFAILNKFCRTEGAVRVQGFQRWLVHHLSSLEPRLARGSIQPLQDRCRVIFERLILLPPDICHGETGIAP
jgi:hypothetical protein